MTINHCLLANAQESETTISNYLMRQRVNVRNDNKLGHPK